ncbi:unnamed protein product [Coregonus sp. 'balchen']|nr:unnamed protein product [Coregonus sp. 'balchen']
MGCGGSRSDTIIEPRYHESWTRETESTWLTNTDAEAALSTINSKKCRDCGEYSGFNAEKIRSSGPNHQTLTSSGPNHQTLTNSGPNHQNLTSSRPNHQTLTRSGPNHQTLTSSGPSHRWSCHDVGLTQTKKESRRRASKEVTAPSKEVQAVSGSGDNVPLSQAWDAAPSKEVQAVSGSGDNVPLSQAWDER